MKIITKEWKNCYDLLGVIYDLRKETGWKLPVLIDGTKTRFDNRKRRGRAIKLRFS